MPASPVRIVVPLGLAALPGLGMCRGAEAARGGGWDYEDRSGNGLPLPVLFWALSQNE